MEFGIELIKSLWNKVSKKIRNLLVSFFTEEIRPEVSDVTPSDSCALPVEPGSEEIDEHSGFRFGKWNDKYVKSQCI